MREVPPLRAFSSFTQILPYQANLMPNVAAFLFHNENGDGLEVSVSYLDLHLRACQIANQLAKNTGHGDRCILLYKPGIDYIAAFFACLYTKLIAVPVFLSGKSNNIERLQEIVINSSSTLILSTSQHAELVESFKISCLFSDTWDTDTSLFVGDIHASEPDDIAFLQYSSGSTGQPKGVQITHKNLLVNTAAIIKNFAFTTHSRGIIWLPPYHDMGLIGGILASIYGGIELVLTPPSTFIQNPLNWLSLISTYKGTISGGPNFAYELCIKQMERRPDKNLDLSTWEIAFCGAEPIFPETLNRFVKTFSPYGFRKEAFLPCYGLAEATLMVSCKTAPRFSMTRHFSKQAFISQNITEVEPTVKETVEMVSCGEVISEHHVSIVDPKSRKRLKFNEIGEIWVKGASITTGYWKNPEANRNLFSSIEDDYAVNKEWLRTGDLGFFVGNELFIAGRLKELLIINGLNYYPQDVENAIENAHPAILSSVAFSIEEQGSEKLIVVIEVRWHSIRESSDLIEIAVRRSISINFNLFIHSVLFVKPKSISKTTSGKKQRSLSKAYYLTGKFNKYSISGRNERLLAKNVDEEDLSFVIASYLGINKSRLNYCSSLLDLGLDSIKLLELKCNLEEHFAVSLEASEFFSNTDLPNLLDQLKRSPKKIKNPICNRSSQLIPATPLQKALWLNYMVEPDNLSFNVYRCFIVEQLKLKYFSQAYEQVVKEQVSLRSTFHSIDEEIFQKIHEKIFPDTLNFEVDNTIAEPDLNAKIRALTRHPFILEVGPLLKIHVFALVGNRFALIFCAHHIVIDFWSINVIFKRIIELYDSLSHNKASANFVDNSLQSCQEYSSYYQNYLKSEQYTNDLSFWLKQYETIPPQKRKNDIPIQENMFELYEFFFNQQQTAEFKNFCIQNQITSFNFSLVLFGLVLSILHRENDICIGLPLAIRDFANAANFVGYCVNLLPIRMQLDNFINVSSLILKVKNLISLTLKHKNFPYLHLIEKIKFPRRADNKLPVFDALFLYQASQNSDDSLALCAINSERGEINLDNATFKMQPIKPHDSQIEFTLNVTSLSDTMCFVVEYATSSYNKKFIQNFARAYMDIFSCLLDGNVIRVNEILHNSQLIELLSKIPLNPSIKNDLASSMDKDSQYCQIEARLINIWISILQKNEILPEDNFFALGGTSLMAVQLANQIGEAFNVKIDIRNIFRYQSIKTLAEHIKNLPAVDFSSQIPVLERVLHKQITQENN